MPQSVLRYFLTRARATVIQLKQRQKQWTSVCSQMSSSHAKRWIVSDLGRRGAGCSQISGYRPLTTLSLRVNEKNCSILESQTGPRGQSRRVRGRTSCCYLDTDCETPKPAIRGPVVFLKGPPCFVHIAEKTTTGVLHFRMSTRCPMPLEARMHSRSESVRHRTIALGDSSTSLSSKCLLCGRSAFFSGSAVGMEPNRPSTCAEEQRSTGKRWM